MAALSIYDARLATVISDAEAYTAMEGARDQLARGGMVDCAFTLNAFLHHELKRPGPPRWEVLSGVVERLGQRNESGSLPDEKREFAGDVLVGLCDAINRAWEASVQLLELLGAGDPQ